MNILSLISVCHQDLKANEDWPIQVHLRFCLLPETLFLCIDIIDRFLFPRVISLVLGDRDPSS